MQILLIEPDTVLARLYSSSFERLGHKVMRVTTAQAAVTVADIRTPDVIIMELQLVNHSGVAFLYEFRSYADWAKIPIIINSVISPVQIQQYQQAFAELGVVKCLYKPSASLRNLVRAAEDSQVSILS